MFGHIYQFLCDAAICIAPAMVQRMPFRAASSTAAHGLCVLDNLVGCRELLFDRDRQAIGLPGAGIDDNDPFQAVRTSYGAMRYALKAIFQ